MDYDRIQHMRAFLGTNLALGLVVKDVNNQIGYRTFKHRHTLYPFDLTLSLLDGDQFEMAKAGPLSIEIKFASVIPAPIQVKIYTELESVVAITMTQ